MTERLYYYDSNRLDFEAKVTATGRHEGRFYVALDRSAFYPTSGGQPYDTGTLNGMTICDVIESEDGEVRHLSVTEIAAVGQSVVGLIDKERRRRNCRNHTGQHILSAAAARLFDLETMSVHLGDDYGAVELDGKTLTPEQVQRLESTANDVIADNVEIEIIFADAAKTGALPLRKPPKREGQLRIIRIGQFDYVACGGTHCTTTGGVGLVKIIGLEKIRGRVLVKYLAGRPAIADYTRRFEITDSLARAFTCHPTDLVAKVNKLTSDHRELRQALVEAQKQLLPGMVAALAGKAVSVGRTQVVVEVVADLEPTLAGRLAGLVSEATGGLTGLLTEGRLLLAGAERSELHAGDLARKIAASCSLKGGGSERKAQLGGAEANDIDSYRAAIHALLKDD